MGLHLTVAPDPALLVDAVAEILNRPPPDPFTPDVVAVPGDGLRAWLTAELSHRLGVAAGADGIIANVEFVFPASLVARALGDRADEDPWSVGPLGWSVHEVLRTGHDEIGIAADAVRARSIADLLDRYALHRPGMVRNWERGADVDALGRAVPEHLRWQPRLWRALCDRLGHPSGPAARSLAAAELRTGRRTPDLPGRVVLVGLASMPPPHLEVLSAVSEQIDVHVVAPVWSLAVWRRVRDRAAGTRPTVPIDRSADPTVNVSSHPLGAAWGRTQREAQLLLALAADEAVATIHEREPPPGPVGPSSLLSLVRSAVAEDAPPPGVPIRDEDDHRPMLADTDVSVRWHRCHGPARQAEVVRDVVLRLLDETDDDGRPRFEPRDIVLLCPDPSVFAAPLRAAFAGDPAHGLPVVPVRIADRSLRADAPLLDVVAGLLELTDGRMRASELLAFAAAEPVAQRFGFGADELDQLAAWVGATNIRWGSDPGSRARFGVSGAVVAHTWQHGLDQIALGVAMADPDLRPAGFPDAPGPGGTARLSGVEGDAVEVYGVVAEFVEAVRDSAEALARPAAPTTWCAALIAAVGRLCSVPDEEVWQWRHLERLVATFAAEAERGGGTDVVAADELVALFSARLAGRPGRPRFGTGAVTLSSLTALRGVPHRVIAVLGLDDDPGIGSARTDDLTATAPCVGDADIRSERRAQLLDALSSAGERLVLVSTGADVRTNAEILPAVALSELLDVLDATARPPSGAPAARVRDWISIRHPRHAWSRPNFEPGALGVDGPWSFDAAARSAATSRERTDRSRALLTEPLADRPNDVMHLPEVLATLRNPVRTLLRQRLGLTLADGDDQFDDLVPLALDPLRRYELRSELLATRLADRAVWSEREFQHWVEERQRRGDLPPVGFGADEAELVRNQTDALIVERDRCCAPTSSAEVVEVDLDIGGRRLIGAVGEVHDGRLVDVVAATISEHRQLVHRFRLVVLAAVRPDRVHESSLVGLRSGSSTRVVHEVWASTGREEVDHALEVVIDLHHRARHDLLPVLPTTSKCLAAGRVTAAIGEWNASYGTPGDGDDPWVRFAYGDVGLEELLDVPARPDESGPGWSRSPARLQRWSERLWGALDAATVFVGTDPT